MVPGRWLHLTMQDVGFSNEVSDTDLTAIISAARTRLAAVEPLPIMIGPARAASEGVACDIIRADALDPLRDVLRAAIADIWGPERVPEGPKKTPHVSVAYATTAGSAGSINTVLNNDDVTAVVKIRTVQLARLDANPGVYQWETCASIPLG
jgi:2'-5' RNA ligase